MILYMFSVSLGAILLSLYYVFLWKNPHTMAIDNRVSPDHDDFKGSSSCISNRLHIYPYLQDNLTTAEPGLASLVSPGGRSDLEEVSLDPGLPGLHGLEDPDYDGSAFTKQARGEVTSKHHASHLNCAALSGVPPAPPARDKTMTLVHNRHQMKGWKMKMMRL